MTISQTFIIFGDCQFWGVLVRCFVEYFLIWVCLVFFSWLDSGYAAFGDRPQRWVLFSSHYIRTACCKHDLTLWMFTLFMWLRQGLSDFLILKLLFPTHLASILNSFGRKLLFIAPSWGVGVMLHLFEGTISTQTICSYSGEDIYLFSHSFILSLIYITMLSWIFMLYFGL